MQLTMSGEYGIRAMLHIASFNNRSLVQILDISKEWGIPESFLRKIIPQLAKAGLINSHRGMGGGLELAKTPDQITALEVIEAVEGKMYLNRCLFSTDICERSEWCSMHTVWIEAQEKLKEVLNSKTLTDLIEQNNLRRKELNIV